METTKDRVMNTALTLFSEKGYDGVSMRDIASAVGIKAASLYNHFKSKEDIFDGIMEMMSQNYEKTAQKIQLPNDNLAESAQVFSNITQDELIEIASKLFLYFLKDDYASKFRRMLTIEQYRNKKAATMFKKYFIEDVISYQSSLFEYMIRLGHFKKCDPRIMATHFYAPIFMLLLQYDNNYACEETALDTLAEHVKQFSMLYQKE